MTRGPARRGKDRTLIAGVDLGASKAACFIARLNEGDVSEPAAEIIGAGRSGAGSPSGGPMSPAQLENALRRAVDAAERMAGIEIDRVVLAAPGRLIAARRIGVDLDIPGGVVAEEDVDACLEEGASLAAPESHVPLHAEPIRYRIDGEALFDDPIGLHGDVLSTELLGLGVKRTALDNLAALLERCALKLEACVAAPQAAAEACLIDDERELGVVLIDIGAASTGYAVYEGGAMVDCGGVAGGAGHITRDIAQIFGAPIAEAERIKTLYGAALIGAGDEHRFVDVPQLGEADERARVSRADLCEVIIPRMEEILEAVSARLPEGRDGGLRRVVVTGGGGLLVGAREVAEKVLSMKARIGRPIAMAGAPEAVSSPGFAVCAGLVQYGAKRAAGGRSRTRGPIAGGGNFSVGARGQSPHSLTRPAMFGGVEAWLRAKF